MSQPSRKRPRTGDPSEKTLDKDELRQGFNLICQQRILIASIWNHLKEKNTLTTPKRLTEDCKMVNSLTAISSSIRLTLSSWNSKTEKNLRFMLCFVKARQLDGVNVPHAQIREIEIPFSKSRMDFLECEMSQSEDIVELLTRRKKKKKPRERKICALKVSFQWQIFYANANYHLKWFLKCVRWIWRLLRPLTRRYRSFRSKWLKTETVSC